MLCQVVIYTQYAHPRQALKMKDQLIQELELSAFGSLLF